MTTTDSKPPDSTAAQDLQLQIQYRLVEQLSASERRYRELLELLDEVVVELDRKGQIQFVNAAWQRLVGAEQPLGRSFMDFVVSDQRQQHWPDWSTLEAAAQRQPVELLVDTAYWPALWMRFRLRSTDTGFVGSLYDISTHKADQQALRLRAQEARKLSLVASNTQNAVIITDEQGRIEWVNTAFENMTGYSTAEVLGIKPGVVLQGPDTDPAVILHMREEVLRQRSFNVELLNYSKDNRPYWVAIEAQPVFGEHGELLNFIAIETDITDRKARDRALRESEYQYRYVVDNIKDVVFRLNKLGEWTFLNQAWASWTGFEIEDCLGVSCLNFVLTTDRPALASAFKQLVSGEREQASLQLSYLTLRGHTRWCEIFASRALDEAGQCVGVAGTLADITENRRTGEALRLAKDNAEQAARAKAEFLANMSHEIRTPLNAVVGMSGLLLDCQLDAVQREYAETIRNGGDALLDVINEILDFSKLEAGKLALEQQRFNLPECLEDALDLVAADGRSRALDLAYVLAPELPHFWIGDATRLRQVVVNLLSNAVKFTEHGEVVVQVRKLVDDQGEDILIEVRDTGIGICQQRLQHIFDPFCQADASTTRRFGGTGLGLSISRQLAELMGGRLWVESELGQGSSFFLQLPLLPAGDQASQPSQVTAELDVSELAGKRALVVDDNQTNRQLIAHTLQELHMQVHSCASAAQALFAMEEASTDFDIALLDRRMPQEDGISLAGKIRVRQPQLPLMMVSSVGAADLPNQGRDFAACLSKPLKPELLRQTVAKVLGATPLQAGGVVASNAEPASALDVSLQVLVVEDNPVNQKVALLNLQKLGLRASVAGNGLEALAIMEQQPFDIVFMDIQMPEMDGVEATAQIRKRWPPDLQPRIIAMTAHAMEGDKERYLHQGMDDYLCKPVRAEELLTVLERAQQQLQTV